MEPKLKLKSKYNIIFKDRKQINTKKFQAPPPTDSASRERNQNRVLYIQVPHFPPHQIDKVQLKRILNLHNHRLAQQSLRTKTWHKSNKHKKLY